MRVLFFVMTLLLESATALVLAPAARCQMPSRCMHPRARMEDEFFQDNEKVQMIKATEDTVRVLEDKIYDIDDKLEEQRKMLIQSATARVHTHTPQATQT